MVYESGYRSIFPCFYSVVAFPHLHQVGCSPFILSFLHLLTSIGNHLTAVLNNVLSFGYRFIGIDSPPL